LVIFPTQKAGASGRADARRAFRRRASAVAWLVEWRVFIATLLIGAHGLRRCVDLEGAQRPTRCAAAAPTLSGG